MTRHGIPIDEVSIRRGVETGISYSLRYSEWDACVSCNLDLWAWETNMYPKWFKEYVVAFHNLRRTVSLHTEDAVAQQSERDMAKARARRKG